MKEIKKILWYTKGRYFPSIDIIFEKVNELVSVYNDLINKPLTTEAKVSTPHIDILTNKCRGDQEVTVFDLTEAIFELAGLKRVTNERPKSKSKCKCAEGFQGLCVNHIEEGPLEGHCQLNCVDLFRPLGR